MKARIDGIDYEGTPEEIAEIVRLLTNPQNTFQVPVPQVQVPFISGFVTSLCAHDFPVVWHGVVPPVCSKCGFQPQASTYTYTF
jgi:hypothetical protein